MKATILRIAAAAIATLLLLSTAAAGPVYQPPGSNLTFGDVTHGLRVQSAFSNPAAAAADRARAQGVSNRGLVFSAAAGIEYGNVQELFDLYDEIAGGFRPSQPSTPPGPGQPPNPDNGIDIGRIIDELAPELRPTIDAIATELTNQAAILGLIAAEGYARAWVSADVPVVLNGNLWGARGPRELTGRDRRKRSAPLCLSNSTSTPRLTNSSGRLMTSSTACCPIRRRRSS